MAKITYLAQYNEPKPYEYKYTCDSCGSDTFLLIGDGSIECADCGNIMENLTHDGGE